MGFFPVPHHLAGDFDGKRMRPVFCEQPIFQAELTWVSPRGDLSGGQGAHRDGLQPQQLGLHHP